MRTEITWDNLEVGDTLISDNEKCKVLAIIGNVIFVSIEDNEIVYYVNKNDENHTIAQPEPIDEDAPFEPGDGEKYYCPELSEKKYREEEYEEGYYEDIYFKKNKLCFRTPQGAIKATEKIMEALKIPKKESESSEITKKMIDEVKSVCENNSKNKFDLQGRFIEIPNERETYWYITDTGFTTHGVFYKECAKSNFRFKAKNMYKDEESAEAFLNNEESD